MAYYNPPNQLARRRYRRNVKYAKKGYKKVYGSRKFPQAVKATANTAKDIAMLAKSIVEIRARLNVEKNYVDRDVVTGRCGQVDVNSDNTQILDVTPIIAQGDGQGQRHGNSLKITGLSLPVQFSGQSNCLNVRKIRLMLLRVRSADNGVDPLEAWEQYTDVNPLNGLRDMNAPKNYRAGSHDGITCVRTANYSLKAPALLQGTGADYEQSCFSTKFNVKLQEVFRYATNGDSLPDGIRYYLVIQVDAGNSGINASTLDVPVKLGSSGIEYRLSQRSWFVDN